MDDNRRVPEGLTEERNRGLLIAFEGSDGVGKTTQRKLFKTWLRNRGEKVAVSKWNSSPLVKPLMKARKAARSLTPVEYAVLQAADFRHRFDTEIALRLNEDVCQTHCGLTRVHVLRGGPRRYRVKRSVRKLPSFRYKGH